MKNINDEIIYNYRIYKSNNCILKSIIVNTIK